MSVKFVCFSGFIGNFVHQKEWARLNCGTKSMYRFLVFIGRVYNKLNTEKRAKIDILIEVRKGVALSYTSEKIA